MLKEISKEISSDYIYAKTKYLAYTGIQKVEVAEMITENYEELTVSNNAYIEISAEIKKVSEERTRLLDLRKNTSITKSNDDDLVGANKIMNAVQTINVNLNVLRSKRSSLEKDIAQIQREVIIAMNKYELYLSAEDSATKYPTKLGYTNNDIQEVISKICGRQDIYRFYKFINFNTLRWDYANHANSKVEKGLLCKAVKKAVDDDKTGQVGEKLYRAFTEHKGDIRLLELLDWFKANKIMTEKETVEFMQSRDNSK